MNILFIMIPISILLAMTFLGLFIWSNNSGQFEDLEGPPLKLVDDDIKKNDMEKNQTKEAQNARRNV